MRYLKRAAFALGLAAVLVSANAAVAATVVDIKLWDKGAETAMPTDLAYATPGYDKSKATMGIDLSRPSAPAGLVKFNVTNTSKDTIHEMIVIQLSDPGKPLAYIADENRVDEDRVGDKGEVSELEPGKSGALTVALKPGKYILICNVAGHFAAGMWAECEVTK